MREKEIRNTHWLCKIFWALEVVIRVSVVSMHVIFRYLKTFNHTFFFHSYFDSQLSSCYFF